MTKKIERRGFIESSAKGLAAAGIALTLPVAQPGTAGFDKLFIHHVYFWLKKPVSSEAKNKFEKALRELVKIETVVNFHLGVPASTDRGVIDTTYSYSLLLTFKNKADQDVYQTHEKHLKFIADCQDLWEKVVVYDSVNI